MKLNEHSMIGFVKPLNSWNNNLKLDIYCLNKKEFKTS